MVLLHPDSLETLKLNLTGSAVWDLICEARSTEEVMDLAIELCAEASLAVHTRLDKGAADLLRDRLQAFVILLVDKRFVSFEDEVEHLLARGMAVQASTLRPTNGGETNDSSPRH